MSWFHSVGEIERYSVSGVRPFIHPDFGLNMNVDGSVNPITFECRASPGTIFIGEKFLMSIAAKFMPAVNNRGMIGLSYDKFLNLTLTNGIVFNRVSQGVETLSFGFKQVSDFMNFGTSIKNVLHDGTNTFVLMESAPVPKAVRFEQREGQEEFTRMIIRDDLSSLLQFRVVYVGSVQALLG